MTSPSKRDVERDLKDLKNQTTAEEPRGGAAFRTEAGNHYDADGNRLDDLSNVIFVVPANVWQKWGDVEAFTPPPE